MHHNTLQEMSQRDTPINYCPSFSDSSQSSNQYLCRVVAPSIVPLPLHVYKKMAQNRAAWLISEKANPLRVDDAPVPTVEKGTVLIKNYAAAVVCIPCALP